MKFRRVAVLMGGVSSECDVSLRSGRAVAEALRAAGVAVEGVVLDRAAIPPLPPGTEAVFLALHGGYGEDGGAQADLDALGMPYTGSGAQASRLAMDKLRTKRVLLEHGVPTPPFDVRGAADNRLPELPLPVVVKPPRDGSSVGVTRVRSADEWRGALDAARRLDAAGEALVEAYIPGREWTVGMLADQTLPVVEIRAPDGWYGFEAKYGKPDPAAGRPATEYIFPEAPEDAARVAACQELARRAFRAAGCRGLGRVDFRLAPDNGLYVLEINTLPGFTSTSLLPKAAARAGIWFVELCCRVLETARCDAPEAAPRPRQKQAGGTRACSVS
jgi:D-alanine-D-alanine ligase